MFSDSILESTPLPITSKVQLLEKEEGEYTTYVFIDLDTKEYLMVVKYPNWIQKEINILDIGYLTYYLILGGKTKWYCKDSFGVEEKEMFIPYTYTHIAFVKFIKSNEIIMKDSDMNFTIKVI